MAAATAAAALLATPWRPRAASAGAAPGLTGRVVLPGDPDYDADRLDFNQRFDVHPQAIVYCQNSADVANAVAWARAQNLPLAVRSGGHSYEAFSLSPGLVIDLSAMCAVDVDPARLRVVAQPGIRLLPFYHTLAPYDLTVPGGTCETVGLGGLTLGGGIGFLTRKWGTTSDNLIGLEMVDACGRVLRADASRNADLYWACRGGGGSFGIVTEMTFQAQPIGGVTVLDLAWPPDQAGSALSAWQTFAPFWPDDLTTAFHLTGAAAGSVTLDGLFLGDAATLRPLLAPFFAAAPPSTVELLETTYAEAADHFSGQSPLPYFKAKSDYALTPLGSDAIKTISQWLAISPNAEAALELQAYGGAVNRVAGDATTFPHRDTLFSMQYLAHWTDPGEEAANMSWIRGFSAAMRPFFSGYAYSNMCDLDLPDWQHAYYRANYERLVAVKSCYDPDDVFHFAQSIPPRR